MAADLPARAPLLPAPSHQRVVEAFLAKHKPSTRAAYQGELRRMAEWAKLATLDDLAAALLGSGRGPATDLVLRWVEHLEAKGVGQAAINRAVSAVRSMVAMGEALGLVEWTLRVPTKRAEREDAVGPSAAELARMLAASEAEAFAARRHPETMSQRSALRALRDSAVFHLLLRGLRRFEIAGLDLDHVDVAGAQVCVLRKARTRRQWVDLYPEQVRAVEAWLEARARAGIASRALLVGLAGVSGGKRICGVTIWRVVDRLRQAAGLPEGPRFRPHGIRHTVTTATLDREGIEVAQQLAGHASPATTSIYDDAKRKRAKQGLHAIYDALREAH